MRAVAPSSAAFARRSSSAGIFWLPGRCFFHRPWVLTFLAGAMVRIYFAGCCLKGAISMLGQAQEATHAHQQARHGDARDDWPAGRSLSSSSTSAGHISYLRDYAQRAMRDISIRLYRACSHTVREEEDFQKQQDGAVTSVGRPQPRVHCDAAAAPFLLCAGHFTLFITRFRFGTGHCRAAAFAAAAHLKTARMRRGTLAAWPQKERGARADYHASSVIG